MTVSGSRVVSRLFILSETLPLVQQAGMAELLRDNLEDQRWASLKEGAESFWNWLGWRIEYLLHEFDP